MQPAPQSVSPNFGKIWQTVDHMVNGFFALLPNIAIAIIVLILFYLFAKLVHFAITRISENRRRANIGMVLGRLAQWVLLFVGLMIAVAIIAPSVTPVTLLRLLGLGGVAIGFAFKDILQNLLAGILLLINEPFHIGDQILYKDFEGTVQKIETRATFIRTYDGRRVVIPNGDIYTNAVVVNTAFEGRRSQYDVGIGYGDDLREAARLILEVMQNVDGVLQEPAPDVLIVELAGSSVNLRVRWWSKPERGEVVHVGSRVIAAIKERLDAAGIDLPFPTNVVLFHDQTEETDGQRGQQREGWPAAGKAPLRSRTLAATGARPSEDTNMPGDTVAAEESQSGATR